MPALDPTFITTAFDLPGYRIVRNLGLVRGIIVRSRSIVGNIGAGLQSLVGGNITIYTELCEKARDDAFQEMISTRSRPAGTRSSAFDTTRTRSPAASPKSWPMARP